MYRCTLLFFLVAISVSPVALAQDPYSRPGLAVRAAQSTADGLLPQPHLALTDANVVDVRTGTVLNGVTVELLNGKIASVGTQRPPQQAQQIDLRGYYLVPGFFEGHFHGSRTGDAQRALVSGVTTAKSASVGGFMDIALNELVEAGYLAGPEILAAGVYITPELGNTDAILADPRLHKYANRELRGEEALRDVVRITIDRGARWIKTRSSGLSSRTNGPDALALAYSEEELRIIVDEASKFDTPVSCHAHGIEVTNVAIRAGCASIEHGSYIDETGLQLLQEFGTLWVPTYISTEGFALPHDDYNSTIARQRHPHIVENLARMIRRGHEMGLPILTAVDSGYGPDSVYRVSGEINAFVAFGMTPLEALQAATIKSAEAYGLAAQTGAIEAGLDADLIVFDRNPLLQPSTFHNPLAVISNGRVGLNRQVGAGKILGEN